VEKVLLLYDKSASWLSFSIQAEMLERGLRTLGVDVTSYDLSRVVDIDTFNNLVTKTGPNIIVFWTLFSTGHPLFPKKIRRREKMVLFEVADQILKYQTLKEVAIPFINENFDMVVTPSHWSKEAFEGVGVKVVIVPHAVDEAIFAPAITDFKKPTIFVSATHSWERKGVYDLFAILNRIDPRRVKVVLKQSIISELPIIKEKLDIFPISFVPKHIYIGFMKSSHILGNLARSGSFEIPYLEGIICNLWVLMPERGGGWVDIPLRKEDVIWVKVNGESGVDLDDAYNKLLYVLNQVEMGKMPERNINEYFRKYNYLQVASQFFHELTKIGG